MNKKNEWMNENEQKEWNEGMNEWMKWMNQWMNEVN